MKLLLKSVTIVEKGAKLNGSKRDILIDGGEITKIAASIKPEEKTKLVKGENLHVSAGWLDLGANFCDPGYEFKEDINTGLNAAVKGGFTGVMITPATKPVIDNKSSVEYAQRRADGHVCKLLVCGALSQGMEGKQLAELFDMHDSGAVAFGDHKNEVSRTELMGRGLEYVQNFEGTVLSFPYDHHMNEGGHLHEGPASVSLGLKGIPSASEHIRLMRDLELLRYSDSKMHVTLVSSADSVELVRRAKKEGLKLTCGVAAHQLSFLDDDLAGYDTRLKVLPPFRTNKDRKALLKGIKDGTIDAICSDHSPEDTENKKVEFDLASFGISSLETAFASIRTATKGKVDLDIIIERLSAGPRSVIGLDKHTIDEGQVANLTIFDPDGIMDFDAKKMASKSDNTPFKNFELTGRVVGTVRGNLSNWN